MEPYRERASRTLTSDRIVCPHDDDDVEDAKKKSTPPFSRLTAVIFCENVKMQHRTESNVYREREKA